MKIQCEISAFLTGNVSQESDDADPNNLVSRITRAPGLSVNPVVNFVLAEGVEELTAQQKAVIVLSATAQLLEKVLATVHQQIKESSGEVSYITEGKTGVQA